MPESELRVASPLNWSSVLRTPVRRIWLKLSGIALLAISLILALFATFGLMPGPQISFWAFAFVIVVITHGIFHVPHGITSLIGLFYLSTMVFVAGRPLLLHAKHIEDSLVWGNFSAELNGTGYAQLMVFWVIALGSFFGGYFVRFRGAIEYKELNLTGSLYNFLVVVFWCTSLILLACAPFLLAIKIRMFLAEGYNALYIGQTQQSFSALGILSHLDLFAYVLFGVATLLAKRIYVRTMTMLVGLSVLSFVLVGQRGPAGTWILVVVWYLVTVKKIKIDRKALFAGAAVVGVIFQVMEVWRNQSGDSIFSWDSANGLLVVFIVSQGVDYLLPLLSWKFPPPSMLTMIGSVIPVGKVFAQLGLTQMESSNLPSYIASSLDSSLFAGGQGLGGCIALEVFYIVGGVWLLFMLACFALGSGLCSWERRAANGAIARYMLCICLPGMFLLQRESCIYLSFPIIFSVVYLSLAAVLYLAAQQGRAMTIPLVNQRTQQE